MKSFSDFVDKREQDRKALDESWWKNLANSLSYKLAKVGATPQQKAQADAIDTFGTTYQKAAPILSKSSQTMMDLQVPASSALSSRVAGVGKTFDKVVRLSRGGGVQPTTGQPQANPGIPVRNSFG